MKHQVRLIAQLTVNDSLKRGLFVVLSSVEFEICIFKKMRHLSSPIEAVFGALLADLHRLIHEQSHIRLG